MILSGDHIYQHGLRPDDRLPPAAAGPTPPSRCAGSRSRRPTSSAPCTSIRTGASPGSRRSRRRPTSNLISLGIYVFSAPTPDPPPGGERSGRSPTDFGHHVFPAMLDGGDRLFAYPEEGYWQDVGTISAYFDSHMDLLDPEHPLDLEVLAGARAIWRRTAWETARRPTSAARAQHRAVHALSAAAGSRGRCPSPSSPPGVVVEPRARSSTDRSSCTTSASGRARSSTRHPGQERRRRARDGHRRAGRGPGQPALPEAPRHRDHGRRQGGRLTRSTRLGKNVVVFPLEDLRSRGRIIVESGETIGHRPS